MSNPDPSQPENVTPDPLPWSAPGGTPLDRPRTDGSVFSPPDVLDGGDGIRYPDDDERRHLSVFQAPRKPHPHIAWALLWVLGFFLVTQVVGGIVTVLLLFAQLFLSPNRDDLAKQLAADPNALYTVPELANMWWPGILITELIVIAFGWVALRLVAGRDWPRKVALRLPSLPHLILVLLLVPAFMILGDGVDQISKWLHVPSLGLDKMTSMFGFWPWYLGVLIIGFGPGIGEELFCRAFLGRGLVGSHGVVLGVLFTSILFGVLHAPEPRQMIYAPVMGVVLHLIYLWTRSLLMPMLVHTLNNSLSALSSWAEQSHQSPNWVKATNAAGDKPSYLLVYAGAVILMTAVFAGLYRSRARLMSIDGGPPPWQPAYPGVEYPPPYSGTFVSRPLQPSLQALGLGLLGFVAFVACCYACYMVG